MKKLSGLGVIGLLLAVLVVVWLVAQNGRGAVDAARQQGESSGAEGEYGALPGVGEAQRTTSAHSDALADALEKTNAP